MFLRKEKDQLTEDGFYSHLETYYDLLPQTDVKILVGNLYVQIGNEDRHEEQQKDTAFMRSIITMENAL